MIMKKNELQLRKIVLKIEKVMNKRILKIINFKKKYPRFKDDG